MLPALLSPMLRVSGVALSVNYGLNRVRFTSPVRIGARVRAVADVLRVDAVDVGVQVHLSVTVEIEGCDKPACVAETITRLYREQVRKVEEAKE
jgi:acyl dehydratase